MCTSRLLLGHRVIFPQLPAVAITTVTPLEPCATNKTSVSVSRVTKATDSTVQVSSRKTVTHIGGVFFC